MKQRLGGLLVLCLLLAALSGSVALAATLSGTTASETINGTKNNDTIDATQGGKDTVNGNGGDDTINVNDGVADDFANCGNGKVDKVKFDTGDSVDRSCETNGRTEVPIGGTNPPPPPPPPPPGDAAVAMGVFPGNASGNPAWDANMTALKEFETLTGKKAKYVEFFHTMRDGASGNCLTTPNEVKSYATAGYTPLVRYEADDVFTPDAIIAGTADQCLNLEAQQLKSFGSDVLIAPFHEMNGNWMPWGIGQNNTTAADQVAAWKHIHDVFAAAGATNAKFVWNPNVRCPTYCEPTSYSSMYPGDAYVDYLALDGYNWAGVHGDSYRSFDEIYAPSYDEITALSLDKPLIVAEYASTEQSGFDKGAWITAQKDVVKTKYPRIKGMLWFNNNQEGAQWRVDSSQSSLDAYKALLADAYYQG